MYVLSTYLHTKPTYLPPGLLHTWQPPKQTSKKWKKKKKKGKKSPTDRFLFPVADSPPARETLLLRATKALATHSHTHYLFSGPDVLLVHVFSARQIVRPGLFPAFLTVLFSARSRARPYRHTSLTLTFLYPTLPYLTLPYRPTYLPVPI
jgi:hypothetical protein